MIYDIHKPREERDFKEIYPDLNEDDQLKVFIVEEDDVKTVLSTSNGHVTYKDPTFRIISLDNSNPKVKFNKQIIDYGFQDFSKKNNLIPESYIRGIDSCIESIENTIKRKRNQVEYDMDEQDLQYLNYRNSIAENIIKILFEIFEISITILETEWNILNNKISLNGVVESNKFFTLDKNLDKYSNDDGIVPGSIYDQRCAVCNDSDCDNSNAIVFCDGCDIAVHQECYGVAFIPEGQWLCRKCMINKNRITDCVFCPSKTGAFKQLDNSLWSHVICGLWINELYFANPIYMEPIEGIDLIPKSRWKLNCYICKQKLGACIQCSNRNCFQAYHVTCAKRAGLYCEMSQGILGAINNKITLKSFCDKHGPPEWDNSHVRQGIYKTQLYFRDLKILNNQNQKLMNSYKFTNKANIFKWKTDNDTPIAPNSFADLLFNLLIDLKIESQTNITKSNQIKTLSISPNLSKQNIQKETRKIANEICRYWCLKRESKRGAPLIRKNNDFSTLMLYNHNEEMTEAEYCQQIEEKVSFLEILINDINQVVDLSQSTLLRQNTQHELELKNLEIANIIYYPINQIIGDFLKELNNLFDSNKQILNFQKFNPNLSQIIKKNQSYKFKTIIEFEQDVDDFYKVSSEYFKNSGNTFKQIKKWITGFKKKINQLKYTEVKLFESQQLTDIQFVETEGYELKFKEYDYKRVLEENDLSDVETILPEQEVKFQNFINGFNSKR